MLELNEAYNEELLKPKVEKHLIQAISEAHEFRIRKSTGKIVIIGTNYSVFSLENAYYDLNFEGKHKFLN